MFLENLHNILIFKIKYIYDIMMTSFDSWMDSTASWMGSILIGGNSWMGSILVGHDSSHSSISDHDLQPDTIYFWQKLTLFFGRNTL